MRSKTKIILLTVITSIITVGVLLGINAMIDYKGHLIVPFQSHESESSYIAGSHATYSPVALDGGGLALPDFSKAAESTVNAVVHIRSTIRDTRERPEYFDPFEFFFGQGMGQKVQPQPRIGIGSGVIISQDGYIVTNNHVVDKSSELEVTMNNNKKYKAQIIGVDVATDLALIKIDAENLPYLHFGDSDKLKVGEWVLAVGNPFNLNSTVTAGIVSAKGRATMNPSSMKIESFIQTDAAINSGNSGGALVNIYGELVGINTMIYSQTGNYSGYSFAIPSSIASKIVADLKKYGNVQRALLGILSGDVNAEIAEKYDLKVFEGVYVSDFIDKSAAKKAGMKKSDVITSIEGQHIRSYGELQEKLSKYRPGDKIDVGVNRFGKDLILHILLTNDRGTTDITKGGNDILGAKFKMLTDEQKNSLNVSYGVEVLSVDAGKLKDAGISRGFVILTVNGIRVTSPEMLSDLCDAIKQGDMGEKAMFIKGVYANGKVKYYAIDLS